MTKPLDELTIDDFEPAVGRAFAIELNGVPPIRLTLAAARAIADDRGDDRRSAFALDFRGPAEPVLPQDTYRLVADGLGPLEIFIVPVGRDGDGTAYEAIFT